MTKGLDEIDRIDQGMCRVATGGQRYLLGEIANGAPQASGREGTVILYRFRPLIEASRSYEPLSHRRKVIRSQVTLVALPATDI